jgi:hypothetical protein
VKSFLSLSSSGFCVDRSVEMNGCYSSHILDELAQKVVLAINGIRRQENIATETVRNFRVYAIELRDALLPYKPGSIAIQKLFPQRKSQRIQVASNASKFISRS